MSPKEMEQFPCDIRREHWSDILKVYVPGIRKYVLKEEVSPQSVRDNMKRVHIFTKYLLLALVGFVLYMIVRRNIL